MWLSTYYVCKMVGSTFYSTYYLPLTIHSSPSPLPTHHTICSHATPPSPANGICRWFLCTCGLKEQKCKLQVQSLRGFIMVLTSALPRKLQHSVATFRFWLSTCPKIEFVILFYFLSAERNFHCTTCVQKCRGKKK